VIYDPSHIIGTTKLNAGDLVTTLTGTVTYYPSKASGYVEFGPTAAAGAIERGAGQRIIPTLVDASTTTPSYECQQLMTLKGVTIAQTGNWAASTSYPLLTPTGLPITSIYIYSKNTKVIGLPIYVGTFDVTGIAMPYGGAFEIDPLNSMDVPVELSNFVVE
jgi:hypothetical protein